MTNSKKFEIALMQRGKTKKDIAVLLGISLQSVYNKVNNVVDFKGTEISAIIKFLKLSSRELHEIFFAN